MSAISFELQSLLILAPRACFCARRSNAFIRFNRSVSVDVGLPMAVAGPTERRERVVAAQNCASRVVVATD